MSKVSASLDELQHALALLRLGRLAEADVICNRVLQSEPRAFHALHMRGIIALQSQDLESAERWLRAATAADPSQAPAWSNLSIVCLARRSPDEALQHAEAALRLAPHSAEAWANRANAHRRLQRHQEALAGYDTAISLAPGLRDAHLGRGAVLLEREQFDAALRSYLRVLAIDPNHVDALNDAGVCLLRTKRFAEALAAFERALAHAPTSAAVLNNRGSALRRLGRAVDAADSYRQALALEPNDPQVLSNLANALLVRGMLHEALENCERALALAPRLPDALNIRATLLRDLGRHVDAAEGYARLATAAPEFDYALGNWLFARANICDWSGDGDPLHGAEPTVQLIESVQNGRRTALPFSFLSMSQSASLQLQCARAFVADRCSGVPRSAAIPARRDRIRVAYVSGDFGEHPVSYLLAGLFERHDRTRFEITAIALKPIESSPMGVRLASAFERVVDVSDLDDREVAAVFAELQIDIAIDLTGFTAGMRPEIFAQRLAPIQVNYLGFPGTMGADFMDYLIADDYVVPQAARRFYAEQIVYLPDCYQCFDDARPTPLQPTTRAAQGLPDGAFVWCSFNNTYKLNAPLFAIWMRLLDRVAGSVLWLVAGSDTVRHNLRHAARRHGIDPGRLLFARRCPYGEHLARLPLADLFLDSLPFNAGATASDALSMGLPVLTVSGEAFAARMAGSLLRALGLTELIGTSAADYESCALRLAQNPAELRRIRERLTAQRRSAPLFDTDRFRRHLEAAYEHMWERQQRGAHPESFAVARLV